MSAKGGKNGKTKGAAQYASSTSTTRFCRPPIAERALASGGFPYDEELKKKVYKEQLMQLQLELLKLQTHVEAKGERFVAIFEGRDASGKGSCISRFLERVNPRHARSVALSKPTEVERGQWYFQRYVATCRRPATWSSSTAPGTTVPASSAS